MWLTDHISNGWEFTTKFNQKEFISDLSEGNFGDVIQEKDQTEQA